MSRQDIAERFQRETAEHVMTILHDDGLYRQIRFTASGSLDWFDLVTWPYNLIVNGSHGSFHFCRAGADTENMFALFRDSRAGRAINPHYWAEKLRAGEVESWSESSFRQWLVREATGLEGRYSGIVQAVGDQILHSDEHNTECEESARYALASFQYEGVRLSFPEPWELKFTEFHWQYIWSCHAIVWGIAQYDATKAATQQAEVVSA